MIRIATRGSDLALWQANHVAGLLRDVCGVEVSVQTFTTRGDTETGPLSRLGGEGLFGGLGFEGVCLGALKTLALTQRQLKLKSLRPNLA